VLMKKAATEDSNSGASSPQDWVSTNDAMCALTWSRITHARKSLGMNVEYSMFNMSVNGRTWLDPSRLQNVSAILSSSPKRRFQSIF
jgi:hypothetical protein